jgi:hypothetical protein
MNQEFPLSISFHRRSPCSYITWWTNNTPAGGRSSELFPCPIDMYKNIYCGGTLKLDTSALFQILIYSQFMTMFPSHSTSHTPHSCRRDETMSLNCGHQQAYCSPSRSYSLWTAMVEWYWQGKTKELRGNPVPIPLCPPQIQHGLTQARTWACALRRQRLIAWAVAGSSS